MKIRESLRRLRLFLGRKSPTEAIWAKTFDAVEEHLVLGVFYAYGAQVEGDIAEFGTAAGRTASAIARATAACDWISGSPPKKLFLFDSFEGLPVIESPVDEKSPHVLSRVWRPGGLKGLSPRELTDLCAKHLSRDRIVVHAGWFRDTLPKLPDDTKFSMLHVDSDLYQSAIDVLDVCFSRGFIAEGAIICFDDWNCNRASPELGERRAWSEIIEKYSVTYSDGGGGIVGMHTNS